jgi:flagellar motor switch protein FliN/FliY
MSQLSASLADQVLAACQRNAAEAAAALGRALDGEIKLSVGEATTFSLAGAASGLAGPGLALLLKFGGQGLAVVFPEHSGLLPDWYRSPDAAGASKFAVLAQELSRLVVPETLAAEQCLASSTGDLIGALSSAAPAPDAALVTLKVEKGDGWGQVSLVWPLVAPDALLRQPAAPAADVAMARAAGATAGKARDFSQLPHYSRSLLRIRVPVSVHLAAKKETVQEIVEIVPGSIIKFEKGCDELLHMVVGGQTIAEGEAVKIGDKFGFRVTAMTMPDEHFIPVKRPRAG